MNMHTFKILTVCVVLLVLGALALPSSAAGTLALHLPFDEASGASSFADASGNGFTATCPGDCPTAGVSGKVDGALQFDGTDDYVEVPYNAAFNPNGSFTVAAWVKVTGGSNNFRTVVASRGGSPTRGYNLYATNTNEWQFWLGRNDDLWHMVGTEPVVYDTWTHVAGVYDSANQTIQVYVNGQPAGSQSDAAFAPNIQYPLRVGAGTTEQSPLFFFPGEIDEVRVYASALTQAEIEQLAAPDVYAADEAYSVRESAVLTVTAPGVLENDVSTAGTLTATVESPPAHGNLALALDGGFVYTPTSGYTGTVTFTYRASARTLTDTATVTLTVEPNVAPVAADNAYTTDELMPLTVAAPGVLGNDSDANGDTLTATLTTAPSRGTLALDLDGSFVYTPALGFPGEYTFTYEASDGTLSDTATVTLTVEPNLAPTAQDDAYTAYQNVALTVAAPGVLDNDSDAHGHTLTATLATDPSHGTVEVQLDGAFTYTPTTGYMGTDTFRYTASDTVLTDTATVTLTVARPPCQVDTDHDGATNYASADAGAVQQAVDAAAPGDLIRVAGTCAGVQNRHTWYSQTVYIDRSLTLQGGYSPDDWAIRDPKIYSTTLDAERLGRVLYISGTGTVTLDGLRITRGFAEDDNGGGVRVDNGGTLTVTQSTFADNEAGNGGALYGGGATLFIAGSTFTGNHAYNGGGVYVWGNALTLSDTLFHTNTADYNGGALYSENNALTLEEVTLRDNQSGESGGGVYATNSGDGTFFATRSTFQENHASYRGGALSNTGAPITITHSAFYTNTTGHGNGGAVYATSVSTVLDDVEFSGNAAPVESSGGAVYAGWGALAVSNATFRHNNAEYQGGAIHAPTSEVTVAYSTFYSNTAHTGGGVHVGNGMLDVTQSTFRENEVSSNGGGLYAVSSVVTVTQSDFYSNTTLYSEGAGLSMPYSEVLLEDVRFQGNEAQSFGGGIYIYEGDLTMTGGEFRQNRSLDESGGGLYASANSTLNVTQSDFYTNTAHQDGGGIYNGGTFTLTHSVLQGNSALQAGGGVFNTLSNAALNDVTFRHNEATLGGGLYNASGSGVSNPTLTDVVFDRNVVSSSGGGMYNYGYNGESSPTLTRVTFSGNSAHYGGGLYNNGGGGISSPTLTGVTFSDNTAVTYGGGMLNEGTFGDSSPTLTNVIFRHNTVTGANPAYGGAIYFDAESYGPGGSSTLGATIVNGLFVDNGNQHIAYYANNAITAPHFINCTFSGALSETVYVPSFWSSSPIAFTNSIFWGNNGDVTNDDAAVDVQYSIVEKSGYAGTGNVYADPLFVDAAGGNLRLQASSPAIDAGDDGAVPAGVTADLDDLERFVWWAVDMGAYESQYDQICEMPWGEPISLGLVQPITLTFDTYEDLGDLSCLTVTYVPTSHPNATPPLQTGAFWTLSGSDVEGNPVTSGFTVILTLPYAGANAGSRACRYPGGMGGAGWDCGDGTHTTYNANNWVRRSHVTSFSDWAVGNDVGPTAITLTDFRARGPAIRLSAFGVSALLGMGFVLVRRVQPERER